jgi:predicted RNA-binding protein
MREDEIPEPEDHPDLEAERAFANAVIVEGMKRNPERAREVIAHVTRSFVESGRYSAEEVSAAVDQLLGELEAYDQPRH